MWKFLLLGLTAGFYIARLFDRGRMRTLAEIAGQPASPAAPKTRSAPATAPSPEQLRDASLERGLRGFELTTAGDVVRATRIRNTRFEYAILDAGRYAVRLAFRDSDKQTNLRRIEWFLPRAREVQDRLRGGLPAVYAPPGEFHWGLQSGEGGAIEYQYSLALAADPLSQMVDAMELFLHAIGPAVDDYCRHNAEDCLAKGSS